MGLIKPNKGAALPTLENPAAATHILKDYNAINGAGEKVNGSHVCPDAPELPALSNPAGNAQILSGYDAVNSAMERVQGTHVCKTLIDLMPSRSNPAGANEILTGYQGVDDTGAVVTGAYVPPAAGAEWEEVLVGNTEVEFITHSLDRVTKCYVTQTNPLKTSYTNASNSYADLYTGCLIFMRDKVGYYITSKTTSNEKYVVPTYDPYTITLGNVLGTTYTGTFRYSHVFVMNDPSEEAL